MADVFVVMGNDYPDAVFDNERAAEEHCEKKRAEGKTHQPRIYWRVYQFQLQSKCSSG